MKTYSLLIQTRFAKYANPKEAVSMKRYMRDQFEYLGIKSPQFKELMKAHIAEHGYPEISELDSIARDLWSLPEREYQYAATSLIGRLETSLPENFIETLEYLIVTKSWWDTVDTISAGALGVHFQRFPKTKKKTLAKWRKSENFWLRRACILFQLDYKEETDFDLLREIIRENLGSKEFFINKAIGWALRQHARIDPQGVRQFVKETPLNPLSAREALKRLGKQKEK